MFENQYLFAISDYNCINSLFKFFRHQNGQGKFEPSDLEHAVPG